MLHLKIMRLHSTIESTVSLNFTIAFIITISILSGIQLDLPRCSFKILFVEYENNFAIIEMMGEWNDAIENDIMILKRDIIDEFISLGIHKFILIGENVLNFHSSDDCYYEEWIDDIEDGWVALTNFHPHVMSEMHHTGVDQYFVMGGELEFLDWRTYLPHNFYRKVEEIVTKRLE